MNVFASRAVRSAPVAAKRSAAPAPLPDPDALRRAALAASWQRDRHVGRRRLAWRHLQWFLARRVVPALAVLALVAGLHALLSEPAEAPLAAEAPSPLPPVPGLALRLDVSPPLATPDPPPAADPSSNPPARKAP